jgi:hypothetical protein
MRGSGGLGAVGAGQEAWRTSSRSGRGDAKRLSSWLGRERNFWRGFGTGSSGGAVRGSAGVWFFFDTHQILIRNFPAKVLVLSALLEILFQENGTAGIGDQRAGGRQQDIAGAILHLHATPEKGGVASHP